MKTYIYGEDAPMLADVIAALMMAEDVELVFANNDVLHLIRDSGNYATIGHVDHLTLSYGEYAVAVELDGEGWFAMHTEYFAIYDYVTAAQAFIKRATEKPLSPTGTGKRLEDLVHKDVFKDDPLEEASHALICGLDKEFESDEGHCSHCRAEWSACVCDGGTGSPFD